MIFGQHPYWKDQGEMKFMLGVVNDPYEIPSGVQISQECRDLLKKCFEKDPKKRIKI